MANTSEGEINPRHPLSTIPSDTARTARASMGRNNFYMMVGDSWEKLMSEEVYTGSENGGALKNWMVPTLSIATLLQYKEKLSDRQAEEASRLRVDWKYALHLSMFYPGLSRVMLCIYRQQVYHNPAMHREFQSILDHFIELDQFSEGQEMTPTAEGLLAEVCTQSRLEEVILALRRALEVLATDHPKWLRMIILPHWYTSYHLFKAAPDLPVSSHQQRALAERIGADILYLFKAVFRSDRPELGDIEEIIALQRIWLEQFEPAEADRARLMARCSFCGSLNIPGTTGE
jgi:transposase